jgi:hypothetical protein
MSFGIFLSNLGMSVQRFSKVSSPATQTSVASTVAKKALQAANRSDVSKENPVKTLSCSILHLPKLMVAGAASIFQSFLACFRD